MTQRMHLPVLADPELNGTTLCGRYVSLVKLVGPDDDPTCKTCARLGENQ